MQNRGLQGATNHLLPQRKRNPLPPSPTMTGPPLPARSESSHLRREIGLTGLVATGIAAMVGVGVNILPFMVQRYQPGIGPWVPVAYVIAAMPAVLAALCY